MRVAVPMERAAAERRVALVPDVVARLAKAGFEIVVEAGAGTAAGFPDAQYEAAGATVVAGPAVYDGADIVVKVKAPTPEEVALLPSGSVLVGVLDALTSPELVRGLAERHVSAVALELVPRITRAQKMDVLSSQATVAGYKAVLLAAARSGKFFPMLMTAAGTVPPAKVLILGAGVAGLQAIATARRLGAVVEGYDVRPEVKEQVESLGARFVGTVLEEAVGEGGYAKEVGEETRRRQQEMLTKHVREADVVITTAQVPGRRAPLLITRAMMEGMKPGSVVVDLAAESGGNVEATQAGVEVEEGGVVVLGPVNLPATLPLHASQMYARNVQAVLEHLAPKGELKIDVADEITAGSLVTHAGEVVHARVREAVLAAV
jgi:H+-translocating NAD(P) transhydrogenase subunit alpha